jgi:hypothetical protein
MADEIVSINNLKENTFKFELSVKGLNEENFDAKFVIHSTDMELAFPCKKDTDGKWSVTVPPLPMLERTMYPFHLQVVAEGFQFRPLKGSVNIVGSPEVYASGMKNTKLENPTKVVETSKTKPQPTKSREKPVEQIARELMEANKASTKKTKVLTETVKPAKRTEPVKESLLPKIDVEPKPAKPDTSAKDEAARKVLEDLGFNTKISKPSKRFSLKD